MTLGGFRWFGSAALTGELSSEQIGLLFGSLCWVGHRRIDQGSNSVTQVGWLDTKSVGEVVNSALNVRFTAA